MSKYIGKRLLMMVPVLLGVMVIVFSINYFTPGDPARMILGDGATPEALEQVTEELGLNDPYLVQLGRYIGNVVFKLDFGESYMTGKPVIEEIASRFPTTVQLAILSVTISVLVGVTAGIISATKQYSIFDRIATSISLLGVSMPTFWAGLMAVLIFPYSLAGCLLRAPMGRSTGFCRRLPWDFTPRQRLCV